MSTQLGADTGAPMPSRVLREGILHSDRVDTLDAGAEVFYRRLMSKVDDYGLFDARLSMLRASLYPLRGDRVTDEQLCGWLSQCIDAGLLLLYQVDAKQYVKMLDTRWKHRSEPKYPPPAGNCAQLQTPVHLDVVVCRCRLSKSLSLLATPSPAPDAQRSADRAPQKGAFKKMPEQQGPTPEHVAKQRRIAALIVEGKFDEAKKLRDA